MLDNVAIRERALVIEDDPNIASGVEIRLQHEGFETSVAEDGIRGLAAIDELDPAIVLLDVQMPHMDGITMLQELRRKNKHSPPVIMLSASLRDQKVSLDAGAQYFLKKPYRTQELLDAIDAVLHREPI